MTILLVDDNPVNLFVIEKILKSAGYSNCISLKSAIELFDYLQLDSLNPKYESVDLILLDIMMPEIDGIEACQRIQQVDVLKDIPIIFITAIDDTNKLAEALDVGGTDYITKPINKTELLARIRVALRLKYEKDWHKQQDEKLRNELDLATQVQRSLLNPPMKENKIQIQVSHLPSFKLAGDMYYWYKIDDHRYAVILFDMMGHGLSASLVCMFISSVLRESVARLVDPEHVIRDLNRYMTHLYNPKNVMNYYFTAIYLVIDTENKTVEYVNAGHPPGYAYIDEKDFHSLERGCCPVGLFEEFDVKKSTIQYEKSIQILLYTDGVIDANIPHEEKIINKMKALTEQKWEMNESPIHMVLPEEKHTNQPDDMCILMIKAE
ncbi:SpoIIE family protein phosphatase [Heyndrickxia vini]|uniref:Fused response regulator/phosphatase n=1 Tax=Heyndrickxia vini TaxID=1476025 RepID=A0ABX7E3N8_9BACI|nr:fused response regulator/phosphatase [Heyndrickxia vini]QQZ10176.1 fused response regulator/phosphatase [Heyndrickxia vini]